VPTILTAPAGTLRSPKDRLPFSLDPEPPRPGWRTGGVAGLAATRSDGRQGGPAEKTGGHLRPGGVGKLVKRSMNPMSDSAHIPIRKRLYEGFRHGNWRPRRAVNYLPTEPSRIKRLRRRFFG